jgi:hypothetical protein
MKLNTMQQFHQRLLLLLLLVIMTTHIFFITYNINDPLVDRCDENHAAAAAAGDKNHIID